MLKSRLLGAVGIVAVVARVLAAQTPASPAFDVASIKVRTVPGGGPLSGPDRYNRSYVSLRDLILDAYGLQQYEVVGGPDWIAGSVRFDVAAKAPFAPTPEQLRLMVQRLLAERFALVAHRETRQMPTYVLRLARNDGRLGKQLNRTTADCEAIKADRIRKGEVPPLSGPNDVPVCSSTMMDIRSPAGMTLRYRTSGTTSGELAAWLSNIAGVGRPVVDRTGLTGMFDLDLSFGRGGLVAAPAAPGDEPAPVFTALQEQLGLKLDSATGPVDVLVIDHVEHPTEN